MTMTYRQRLLRCADSLADLMLSGRTDKQGRPLIEHCRRAAAACAQLSTAQQVAALLHDCGEDGGLDRSIVAGLFGEATAQIFDALTRRPGEPYRQYIEAMPEACPAAVPVKLADLGDNLDASRGPIPDRLRKRYEWARATLVA